MKRYISLTLVFIIILSISFTGVYAGLDNENEEKETGIVHKIIDDPDETGNRRQALRWHVGYTPSTAPVQSSIIGWNVIFGYDDPLEFKNSKNLKDLIIKANHSAIALCRVAKFI